jgi:hypothetical protein
VTKDALSAVAVWYDRSDEMNEFNQTCSYASWEGRQAYALTSTQLPSRGQCGRSAPQRTHLPHSTSAPADRTNQTQCTCAHVGGRKMLRGAPTRKWNTYGLPPAATQATQSSCGRSCLCSGSGITSVYSIASVSSCCVASVVRRSCVPRLASMKRPTYSVDISLLHVGEQGCAQELVVNQKIEQAGRICTRDLCHKSAIG